MRLRTFDLCWRHRKSEAFVVLVSIGVRLGGTLLFVVLGVVQGVRLLLRVSAALMVVLRMLIWYILVMFCFGCGSVEFLYRGGMFGVRGTVGIFRRRTEICVWLKDLSEWVFRAGPRRCIAILKFESEGLYTYGILCWWILAKIDGILRYGVHELKENCCVPLWALFEALCALEE